MESSGLEKSPERPRSPPAAEAPAAEPQENTAAPPKAPASSNSRAPRDRQHQQRRRGGRDDRGAPRANNPIIRLVHNNPSIPAISSVSSSPPVDPALLNLPDNPAVFDGPTFNLFVGDLHKSAVEADLRAAYEPFGPVHSVTLLRDKRPPYGPRGAGFVNFSTAEGLEAAVGATVVVMGKQTKQSKSENRDTLAIGNVDASKFESPAVLQTRLDELAGFPMISMEVKENTVLAVYINYGASVKAYQGLKDAVLEGSKLSVKPVVLEKSQGDPFTLFIKNLSINTTDEGLRALLANHTTVVKLGIVRDHQTGASRQYAFATLTSQEECEKIVKILDNSNFEGNEIGVKYAEKSLPGRGEKNENGQGASNRGDRRGGSGRSGNSRDSRRDDRRPDDRRERQRNPREFHDRSRRSPPRDFGYSHHGYGREPYYDDYYRRPEYSGYPSEPSYQPHYQESRHRPHYPSYPPYEAHSSSAYPYPPPSDYTPYSAPRDHYPSYPPSDSYSAPPPISYKRSRSPPPAGGYSNYPPPGFEYPPPPPGYDSRYPPDERAIKRSRGAPPSRL